MAPAQQWAAQAIESPSGGAGPTRPLRPSHALLRPCGGGGRNCPAFSQPCPPRPVWLLPCRPPQCRRHQCRSAVSLPWQLQSCQSMPVAPAVPCPRLWRRCHQCRAAVASHVRLPWPLPCRQSRRRQRRQCRGAVASHVRLPRSLPKLRLGHRTTQEPNCVALCLRASALYLLRSASRPPSTSWGHAWRWSGRLPLMLSVLVGWALMGSDEVAAPTLLWSCSEPSMVVDSTVHIVMNWVGRCSMRLAGRCQMPSAE